jgi:hypothetical protein
LEDEAMRFQVKKLVLVLLVCLAVPAAGAQATSSKSATAAFAAARAVWKGTVCRNAAEQGGFWLRAASDLRRAKPEPRAYKAATARLRNLASLPETDATPRQMEEGPADTSYLDGFFHTPGLYTDGAQCPF